MSSRMDTLAGQKLYEALQSGAVSASEHISSLLSLIKEKNDDLNMYLHSNENALADAKAVDEKIKAGSAGKLAGLGFAIKANINVVDMPISCASKTLEDYKGTFDADVVTRIRAEDGIILGIVNCDEFACGSSGETSAFGVCVNPAAVDRVPGGSSSGSAAVVAAGLADVALGSDTGGSIRVPASHCGVVGVKPSYGRVSRYGLIDLSMSLDQIGPLSCDVFLSALTMEVISGHSHYDATTHQAPVQTYSNHITGDAIQTIQSKGLRIGVVPAFDAMFTDEKLQEHVQTQIESFISSFDAAKKVALDFKYITLAVQTYYPLVYVEFYSATRKLDGRRFGKKIEDSCGEEVLRRLLGGEEVSRSEYEGTYYRKALAAKELIKAEFEQAFEKCDVIIMPTVPSLPQKLSEPLIDPKAMYALDSFSIPANLAEICAITVPAQRFENIPVGIQICAKALGEAQMFAVAKMFEEHIRQ